MAQHWLYYTGKPSVGGVPKIGRASWSDIISLTKDSNNPIFNDPNSPNGVRAGSVVRKGTNDYVLVYTYGVPLQIGIAFGADGINFTPYDGNPIIVKGDFTPSLSMISMPDLVKIGTKWYIVVEGALTAGGYRIFMASSTDLLNWSVENGGNTIYTPEPTAWDSYGQANPQLREIASGKYVIFYNGEASANDWDLGVMYSTSLTSGWVSWANNPIITRGASGTWDDTRIESPKIVLDDVGADVLRLWYFGLPTIDSMTDGKIGCAKSVQREEVDKVHDLLDVDNFAKCAENPILTGTLAWEAGGIRDDVILVDSVGFLVSTAPPPAPTISAISPSWALQDQARDIHVYGTDFVDCPTVKVNGNSCSNYDFINSTHFTCTVPAISGLGFYDVKVTNPDEQTDTLYNGYEVRETPPSIESKCMTFGKAWGFKRFSVAEGVWV